MENYSQDKCPSYNGNHINQGDRTSKNRTSSVITISDYIKYLHHPAVNSEKTILWLLKNQGKTT